MTPTEAPSPATAPSCHYVRLYVQPDGEPGAACPTLPEPILAEIRESVLLHRKPARWVHALDAIRIKHHLPGLAAWFTGDTSLPPSVRPILHPFEPLRLSPYPADTLHTLLEGQGTLDREASGWLRAGVRRQRLLRWGAFVLLVSALIYDVIRKLRGAPLQSSGVFPAPGFILILEAGLMGIALLLMLVGRQWLLIPQGVLQRNRTPFWGRSLNRFTRSDTTLLITPQESSWSVYLCRAQRVHMPRMGNLEALALVATWQSPAPAPELSALGDYQ